MPNGVTVPLTFQIYSKEGELLRTETLTQDVIRIGKLSSSHLRVDDDSVSRMHAMVEVVSPTEIYVLDLGSNTGTSVNGQKLDNGQKARLQSGDELLLGDAKVVIAIGEPVAESAQERTMVGELPPQVRNTAISIPTAPAPEAGQQVFFNTEALTEAVEVRDGSKAIEVVAMFEDAVIDTRYFTNPAAGVVQGATKGLLATATASLVGAFALFVTSYVQVANMKAARELWEKANPGRSSSEFPIPHEGPLVDILMVTLLAVGGVTLVLGLLRLFEERRPRHFTIGPDPQALVNVPAEEVPSASFPLVHSTGTAYELLITKAMLGDVTLGSDEIPLDRLISDGKARPSNEVQGAFAYAIPEGARALVAIGESTFLVNSVPPPRYYPVPLNVDWASHSYTGGAFGVCALFLALIFSIPPDPKSLSLDSIMNDERFAKILIKPPEEKEEQIPEWLKKKGPDEAGGKGKRHKGDEGKMGKKTSKNKAGLYALKGPKDNPDPHLAKMLAEEQAKSAGVLGILKANEGSHLASIFGRDSALGSDAENVLGGLVGTQVGEAYGVGGLGLVGTGRGGGGTGEGTIGLGNLGTIGKGGGGGSGSGYGRGAGGLGGRRSRAPEIVPGQANVRGSLDKEIIRRVVRRHMNEVKFCYDKELAHKADLYGRLIVQFTISGSGQVIAAVVQQSTLSAPSMEQCVAAAVRRWEFPKPEGGGIVIVNYPFAFNKAGGGEE